MVYFGVLVHELGHYIRIPLQTALNGGHPFRVGHHGVEAFMKMLRRVALNAGQQRHVREPGRTRVTFRVQERKHVVPHRFTNEGGVLGRPLKLGVAFRQGRVPGEFVERSICFGKQILYELVHTCCSDFVFKYQ